MKIQWKLIAMLSGILLLALASLSFADILIITNNSVPETSLSKQEIKNIFLGKKTRWSDDQKIHFAVLNNTATQKNFLKTYINKTVSQYRNYFQLQVFTGKGKKPVSFKTEAQMIKYIAETDGAIGYIKTASVAALDDFASSIQTINYDFGGNLNLGLLAGGIEE